MKFILNEIDELHNTLAPGSIERLAELISASNGSIIGIGAGRMGYALQAFIMRVSHLGYRSFMLGDTTMPRLKPGDIVLVNSSSGETPTIALLSTIAKKHGATVVCITSNPKSTIANLSDHVISYAPIKTTQMMKTVYEQFTFLLFDYCASYLKNKSPLSTREIEINHSVLE